MSGRRRVTEGGAGDAPAVRRVRRRRRPVKFIWGAGKALPGRWVLGLFGYYVQDTGVKTEGLAVSIRGVLAWSGAALVALYLAGAGALYAVWSRNPHSRLTYADALLLPVRKKDVDRKKGQAFLAEGRAALEQKKWQAAISLLQFGLARYPEDRDARLALARIYQMAEQRDAALKVMAEGLTGEFPGREFLATYFDWLEQAENFGEIVRLADGHRRGAGEADQRWLAEQRFLALAAGGRHAEALAAAESEGTGKVALERQVTALLALKRPEEALTRLAAWRPLAGAELWLVTKLQAQALREAGRLEEMEAAMDELRRLLPAEPAALVFRILQRMKAGRTEAAHAALGDYVFRFGGSPENLRLAAKPLAELGDSAGVRACLVAAQERGYPPAPLRVLLIQSHLVAGEWSEASRDLALLPEPTGADQESGRVWRTWVSALVAAAQSPAEPLQRALADVFRGRPWRPQVLRETVAALLLADRLETAREVLALAARAFPHLERFGIEAKEVELRIMARTPAAAASAVEPVLPQGSDFGAELDRLLGASRWGEATQLIHRAYALRPAPDWLEAQEPAVRLAQVRIAQSARDLPAQLQAARLFLGGGGENAVRLLAVAEGFLATGDAAGAVALVKEVRRRGVAAEDAERLLTRWAERVPEARAALAAANGSQPRRSDRGLVPEIRQKLETADPAGMAALRGLLDAEPSRYEDVRRVAEEYRLRGNPDLAAQLERELERRAGGRPAAESRSGAGPRDAGSGK